MSWRPSERRILASSTSATQYSTVYSTINLYSIPQYSTVQCTAVQQSDTLQ